VRKEKNAKGTKGLCKKGGAFPLYQAKGCKRTGRIEGKGDNIPKNHHGGGGLHQGAGKKGMGKKGKKVLKLGKKFVLRRGATSKKTAQGCFLNISRAEMKKKKKRGSTKGVLASAEGGSKGGGSGATGIEEGGPSRKEKGTRVKKNGGLGKKKPGKKI